jgi:hypothetical protein
MVVREVMCEIARQQGVSGIEARTVFKCLNSMEGRCVDENKRAVEWWLCARHLVPLFPPSRIGSSPQPTCVHPLRNQSTDRFVHPILRVEHHHPAISGIKGAHSGDVEHIAAEEVKQGLMLRIDNRRKLAKVTAHDDPLFRKAGNDPQPTGVIPL